MEAGFKMDFREQEDFRQAEKRNYEILEKRCTITKGKKSGRHVHEKPRQSACLEDKVHKNVHSKNQSEMRSQAKMNSSTKLANIY